MTAIFEFIFTEFGLYARHSFDSYGLLTSHKQKLDAASKRAYDGSMTQTTSTCGGQKMKTAHTRREFLERRTENRSPFSIAFSVISKFGDKCVRIMLFKFCKGFFAEPSLR